MGGCSRRPRRVIQQEVPPIRCNQHGHEKFMHGPNHTGRRFVARHAAIFIVILCQGLGCLSMITLCRERVDLKTCAAVKDLWPGRRPDVIMYLVMWTWLHTLFLFRRNDALNTFHYCSIWADSEYQGTGLCNVRQGLLCIVPVCVTLTCNTTIPL